MTENISGINSSSNRLDNVSNTITDKKEKALIQKEKDDLQQIINDLSSGNISEDAISIYKMPTEIKNIEKKSFFRNFLEQLTGKTNHTKEYSNEEIAALIDIEKMACLPE